MKLIIDIPEETYNAVIGDEWIDSEYIYNIINSIQNGTPLSEELKTIKAETIIYELKKIKAEIEKLEYDDFDCNLVLPAWKVYDIIDNYIAELKGEAE